MNQDYKLGGCRMMDITVQNKALKLSWIPCILENIDSFWVQCLQANLHFPIEHILPGNLNKKDMEKCMGNCINIFWYEMLLYWSELFQDVVNQPLWLNSHVKYNKAVLYAQSLVQQGIMLIGDILTTDHKLPTLAQLNAKFNLAWQENTYDKLISAIPIEWRTLIESNSSNTFIHYQPLLYTVKSIKKKATQFFLYCTHETTQCTDTKCNK